MALEFAHPVTVGDIFETRYHGNISELGPCAHNPAGLCLKCKAFKYFSERNPRYLFLKIKYMPGGQIFIGSSVCPVESLSRF